MYIPINNQLGGGYIDFIVFRGLRPEVSRNFHQTLKMKQDQESTNDIEINRCIHCAGVASISIKKHTEKGTWPEIEFCPFCGLSNMYPREFDSKKAEMKKEIERLKKKDDCLYQL